MLLGAWSQCVDGSLWREISIRESYGGASLVDVRWWGQLKQRMSFMFPYPQEDKKKKKKRGDKEVQDIYCRT